MKANELRIGNLITTSYMTSNAFEVTEITKDHCYFKSTVQNFESHTIYPYIEPILLTEEWLLKFGQYTKWSYFGNENYGGYFDFNGNHKLMIRYINDKFNLSIVTVDIKRGFYKKVRDLKKDIKYVHKLQNYYFENTDNELEIK